MTMERLKGGAQFAEVAADFSEDAQTAPSGGDLGFLPVSARVIGADGGHTVVVVVGKDTAGQKDLGTPGVKDAITQALKSRREQLLRTAYISSLRNGAVVENLIAKRVVESQGKVPTLAPAAAPGK